MKKKKFYLIRHAAAEDRELFKKTTQKKDYYRPLSKEGKKSFLKVVKKLNKKKIKLKRVYHSPFLRCLETAQIIENNVSTKRIPTKALGHGKSTQETLRLFKKLKKHSAFVGHEPELSLLFLEFGLRTKAFKKGETRCLEQKTKKNKKSKTITYRVLWTLSPSTRNKPYKNQKRKPKS